VIDARNALDPAVWQAAGWTYRGIGRRVVDRPVRRAA
jgi:UDPglucose 6-dehydrogenase